jgi:hypothetical protein
LPRCQDQARTSQFGLFGSLGGPVVGRTDFRMNFDVADETRRTDPRDIG